MSVIDFVALSFFVVCSWQWCRANDVNSAGAAVIAASCGGAGAGGGDAGCSLCLHSCLICLCLLVLWLLITVCGVAIEWRLLHPTNDPRAGLLSAARCCRRSSQRSLFDFRDVAACPCRHICV